MKILSWNVQWCRGIDGRVDPARIVAEAKRIADFDVLCLQEVADNFPDPRLAGNDDSDQFATLGELLPGYTAVPGIAVDQPDDYTGRRRRFGNLLLSRLPVRQVYRWLLPYPHDPGKAGMPRIAIEAVVSAPFGELRIVTTHLEWYSLVQRGAQVEALRRIYADGYAHAKAAEVTMEDGGPFQTFLRPRATLFCGDFNLEHASELHARMVAPFDDGAPALVNPWDRMHPGRPYPATFCIYNRMGDYGELHCDFFFASPEVMERVEGFFVDQMTQASDHQPIVLTLRE